MAGAAAGPALSLDESRERLRRLEARLDSGDARGASELARALRAEEVGWSGGVFRPDPRVLEAIADGRAEDVREALGALTSQLGDGGSSRESAPPDGEKLSALARAQQSSDLRWGKGIPEARGIQLPSPRTPPPPPSP